MSSIEKYGSGMSRRKFGKLALGLTASIALGAIGLRELERHTEQSYMNLNRWLALRIIANPPKDEADFGIIVDPKHSDDISVSRVEFIRESLGKLNHVGVFFRVEDFGDTKEREKNLQTLRSISEQGLKPCVALGCATSPNGLHPFAELNREFMRKQLLLFAQTILEFGHPLAIRFFFEMNTRNFAYSKGQKGITDEQQVSGFQELSSEFDQQLKDLGIRDQVQMIFNPIYTNTFLEYASNPNIKEIFDIFGLDLYDYEIIKGYFIGSIYFPKGKSPQNIISGPIAELKKIAGNKPIAIGELGTLRNDSEWLKTMMFFLAAENISTFSYFDVDKSSENVRTEGDFRLTQDTISVISNILQFINLAQQLLLGDKAAIDQIIKLLNAFSVPISHSDILH